MSAHYFDHVTLTTGHRMRRSRADTDPVAIDLARGMLDWALAHGGTAPVATRPGFKISSTPDGTALIVTVWGEAIGAQRVPILTTGIVLRSRDAPPLWQALLYRPSVPLAAVSRPQAPWIADRIDAGAVIYPDALVWTGALTPALAWAWADIKGRGGS